MSEGLGEYSKEEFEEARTFLIKRLVENREVYAAESPCAVLLGGQSGAGKTRLHSIVREEFGQNTIVINGDEYRSRHPHYRELDAKYGPDAVSHTALWAGKMTEALIDALSVMRYNLIVEGTLRTSEVPISTATLLRKRGYGVSLALMAVKPEISLISCRIRYEQMRIAGTIPRATDPKHHDKIIHDIVDNLAVLEKLNLFDDVRLFSREGTCLYPLGGDDSKAAVLPMESAQTTESVGGDACTASEALREILFGSWTAEEKRHYGFLQEILAKLQTK